MKKKKKPMATNYVKKATKNAIEIFVWLRSYSHSFLRQLARNLSKGCNLFNALKYVCMCVYAVDTFKLILMTPQLKTNEITGYDDVDDTETMQTTTHTNPN